jgi:hypothetical protein
LTARDLVTGAAVKSGVVGLGQQALGAVADAGLTELNEMLDTWQTDRSMIFRVPPVIYTMAVKTPQVNGGFEAG